MTASVVYQGELRTEAKHLRSGNTITTDAPPDNNGKGEAFSPTDLLATSLVSCKMTIMGIVARNHHMGELQMKGTVNKIMAENPRRVSKLEVALEVAGDLSEAQRKTLEHAARNCPVAKSIHPDIELAVNFIFTDAIVAV